MKNNYFVMQSQSLCLINQSPMGKLSDYIYFLDAFKDILIALRNYSNKTVVKIATRRNGKYKMFFEIFIGNKASLRKPDNSCF